MSTQELEQRAKTNGVDEDTITPGEAAIRQVRQLREENRELRAENERLWEVIESLQGRVDEIDERTQPLTLRSDADELTAQQRRSLLLMHLTQKARNRSDGKPVAEITTDEWRKFLNFPELDRTTFTQDLRRTGEKHGNHPAVSYNDGSLVLDLREVDAPEPETRVTDLPRGVSL